MASQSDGEGEQIVKGYASPDLPERNRIEGRIGMYPNYITIDTILAEVRHRMIAGLTPQDALRTVADGLDNWVRMEKKNGR